MKKFHFIKNCPHCLFKIIFIIVLQTREHVFKGSMGGPVLSCSAASVPVQLFQNSLHPI